MKWKKIQLEENWNFQSKENKFDSRWFQIQILPEARKSSTISQGFLAFLNKNKDWIFLYWSGLWEQSYVIFVHFVSQPVAELLATVFVTSGPYAPYEGEDEPGFNQFRNLFYHFLRNGSFTLQQIEKSQRQSTEINQIGQQRPDSMPRLRLKVSKGNWNTKTSISWKCFVSWEF